MIKWIAWPALAVAGMRSAIAAIVLLLVLREWRPRWSWWLGRQLAGAKPMLGFVVATRLTTAANAIFLVYTAPLYVALLSPWVLHEPIRRGDWLILLAMLGLGCFCVEQLTLAGWVGNGCALGSGLSRPGSWCAYASTRRRPRCPCWCSPTSCMAVVGVRLCCAHADPVSWCPLIAAVQLGLPLVLYGKAIPHVRAIEAVLIPVLEPVLNPVWVLLFIGEVPSGWALLGGAMVLGAVTARGLAMVWPTPREREEMPHRVTG